VTINIATQSLVIH